MFPIVRVDARRAVTPEQMGTKRKFWFRGEGDVRTLFKAEERGTGEDWAEKIACELCELLGLPHVHYELAHDFVADVPGVVCATAATPPRVLVLGNQLLQALDENYPQGSKYKVRGHTVEAVASAVDLLQPPAEAALPAGIESASDVFAGYLMLDAWVANQDRHHENWAAIFDREAESGRQLSLCPTFDHGASLARNLSDEERRERLGSRDANRRVPAFTRRARSALYESPAATRPMTTLAAFRAWGDRRPDAAKVWIGRLGSIDMTQCQSILDQISPDRMSLTSREFTLELLAENRRRLLDGELA